MARKNNEEALPESPEQSTDEPIGESIEKTVEESVEKTVEESVEINKKIGKKQVTVYRNEGAELLLVDSQGNGIRIRTPEEYRNVKKGDIIYL